MEKINVNENAVAAGALAPTGATEEPIILEDTSPAVAPSRLAGITRILVLAFAAAIALYLALAMMSAVHHTDPLGFTNTAFAQAQQPNPGGAPPPGQGGQGGGSGGGGDPISTFLNSAIDTIGNWVTLCGILGIIICCVALALSTTNPHHQAYAKTGIVMCGVAVAAGVLAKPLVHMIEGWAGHGGGAGMILLPHFLNHLF